MSSRIKEDVNKIFEFWCEVRQEAAAAGVANGPSATGTISEFYPKSFRDDQVISKIPEFAYPCEFENTSVQVYSFVWTSDDSKFRFGFCRHDPKTGSAMVIITYLPWHDTFLRLLTVLNDLKRSRNGEFESFLAEAYNKGVPEPGSSLKLYYNSGQNHFTFERPAQLKLPSIPENHNLNLYYNFVDIKNMIAVFAAMLSERRIIFTSRRLDRLSSCIQAASAFLYPMVWQHIFIPILPMKMKDFLCAPMPYLIGVPEAVLRTMTVDELGDVVILNCDSNEFRNPFDDVRHMPPELIYQMKKDLHNPNKLMGDEISRIFLRILVQLIGGYRDAAKYSQGERISWDRDTFVESRPPHLRTFLARMMELQIFQQFIDERLDILNSGQGISDEFEIETQCYMDKMNKKGKNYREFLRNVKDKTNPAVKSAVKSVKEGSRGVKSAYKDLKSKFRDITPPKSQFHVSQSSTPYDSQNMMKSTSMQQNHHSAPNSPVFPKRDLTAEMSYAAGMNRPVDSFPLYTQQSTHDFKSNFSSSASSYRSAAGTDNNSELITSPTISPSNSLQSSEMNIVQELEDHPLFKTPAIDRSLKPSNSLDNSTNARTISRLGAPVTLPPRNHNFVDTSMQFNASELAIKTDTPDYGGLPPIKTNSVFATKSIFDSPPNMPCPPIPPRRLNGSSANAYKQASRTMPNRLQTNSSSSSNSNRANYGNEINLLQFGSAESSTTEISRQKTSNNHCRPTTAIQPAAESDSITAPTKDLISLDDSSSSLDISDFDPLNQNAKLNRNLPPLKPMTTTTTDSLINAKSTTTIPTSNVSSVSNPLYPYFSPTYRNRVEQLKHKNTDDLESELLRQYGLEKLTNGGGDSGGASGGFSQQHAAGKSNWTTFD